MVKFKINILRLSLILLVIIAIISCNEKKRFDGYLYPIRENGLYGFIDSVGNKIIEPEFLWMSTFHNGLAMTVVDTIYRVVPDSMAYEVGERDTILNVYRMYAKYGYIDKSGDFVIEPKFISYVDMSEIGDVAIDMDDCSNALYRNSFRNRRAMFYDTLTWKNGYIDTNGDIVIPPKYYYSEPFSEGLAVVRDVVAEPLYTNKACITPSKLRCAYLDTLGNAVTDFKYESLTRFGSGRGIGSYKKIKRENVDIADTTIVWETYSIPRFLINGDGKEIKELNFNYDYYGFSRGGISVASDGFFMRSFIGKENISYYYIDNNGNFLEPLKGLSEYQLDSLGECNDIIQVLPDNANIAAATYFNEGFAGISPDKKHWFAIDKYLLIHGYGDESIFEGFRAFNNGLAAVKRNGKWGFINRKIKEQIPCKYDSCGVVYPYLEEVFEYDIQGNVNRKAYINRKDSLVWESPLYNSEKIENRYSIKNCKEWGKWTYKYNPIIENIKYWIIVGLGIVLIIALISWESFRVSATKRHTVMSTNDQSLQMQDNVENNSSSNNISVTSTETEEIHFYPSVRQYTETIKLSSKSPEEFFDKLSNLRPVFDENGDPIMSNGNFAVVYKMVDGNGKFHAIRCFHRYQERRGQSYKLICEELNKVSSSYLLPIKYYEKELYIDSVEYPVLLMDWVDGVPLDKYLREIINDNTKLRSIAVKFRQLAIWLLDQPFAHGDLKPDNILVKKDGSLVLVDYDGMFVPAMQGERSREVGSPDFRNPSRTEDDFDKNIDTFPIISILLSLELLIENKDYLSKFGAEDRLLFSEDDYRNIDNSVLFRIALSSYNDDISELAINLKSQLCTINDNNIIHLLNQKEIRNKQKQKNEKIEKRLTILILLYNLFIPLGAYIYSRIMPIADWDPLGVSIGILCSAFFIYIVIVIIDLFRPYKESHLYIDEDYTSWGCVFSLWNIFIALGLLLKSFKLDEWYITLLIIIIWICFFYVLGGITYGAFELRTCIYKTPTEKRIEIEKKEKEKIRTALRIEEQRQKKLQENEVQREQNNNDDLPF